MSADRLCKHCGVRVEKVRNSRTVMPERNGWEFSFLNHGDGFTGWVHKVSTGPLYAYAFYAYAYCDLPRLTAEPGGGDQ